MRVLQTLGLVLIACALFVQSAAYASARPPLSATIVGQCDEMRMEKPSQSSSGEQQGPCKNLRLDCLVAFGCIAPLAMAQGASLEHDPIAIGSQFIAFADFSLTGTRQGPEPPPPQAQI